MPGFLESVNVTIDNNATWEIEEGKQLPQYLDVNIAFKPIFKNLPERSKVDSQMAIITNPNLSSLNTDQLIDTRNGILRPREVVDTISTFNSDQA
jgi:hypothetical protein